MDGRKKHAESAWTVTLFGWLLVAAGTLLIAAGLSYAATGWKYGTVIAIWTAQWGLPSCGIGLGLSRFRRRGTGVIAVAVGLLGGALIVLGETSHTYDSYLITIPFDGASILIGVASATGRRRARSVETAV